MEPHINPPEIRIPPRQDQEMQPLGRNQPDPVPRNLSAQGGGNPPPIGQEQDLEMQQPGSNQPNPDPQNARRGNWKLGLLSAALCTLLGLMNKGSEAVFTFLSPKVPAGVPLKNQPYSSLLVGLEVLEECGNRTNTIDPRTIASFKKFSKEGEIVEGDGNVCTCVNNENEQPIFISHLTLNRLPEEFLDTPDRNNSTIEKNLTHTVRNVEIIKTFNNNYNPKSPLSAIGTISCLTDERKFDKIVYLIAAVYQKDMDTSEKALFKRYIFLYNQTAYNISFANDNTEIRTPDGSENLVTEFMTHRVACNREKLEEIHGIKLSTGACKEEFARCFGFARNYTQKHANDTKPKNEL